MNKIPKYSQKARQQPVYESPEKKQRIKLWMGACMIITAASIDGFQALLDFLAIGLFINWFISPIATFVFILWSWILGLGFMNNPKRFVAMATQAVAGIIPIINTLPELTLGTIALVIITRMEDGDSIISKAVQTAEKHLKKPA